MAETKKYYHNLDVDGNKIQNFLLNPMTTAQRLALSLGVGDESYTVYDVDLNAPYYWDGGAWVTATSLPNQTGNSGKYLKTDGSIAGWEVLSGNISGFTNDAGYLVPGDLSPYLTTTLAALTYYPLSNPSNYIGLSALSAGVGISYSNITGIITNSAPDQTVTITNGGGITVTGSYPNFTLAAAVSGFVPYTGATNDVDLGEHQLLTGQVTFDQSPTGTAGVGVMRWNDTDGTADLGLKGGNVTLQIGQENVVRVVNKSGGNLLEADFQAVRVRLVSEGGAAGQRLAVVLAQGNNDTNSVTTIGLVTETINNNQEGFVTVFGNVNEINTTGAKSFGGAETWVDGDILYINPDHAGYLTNVKPVAPEHLITIGYVVYAHAIHGKIFVKVDNGYELEELHNVYAPSPSNKDSIFWNTVNSRYENNSISGILGYTPIGLTNLSSTATGLTYTNTTGVFSLSAGYVIPTTTEQTNWNTAYGWGNPSGVYLPLVGATYSTTSGNGLALTTSTLTTGNLMKLTNTSTVNNGAGLLSIVSSGANGTASKTTYGQQISVTNTGATSTNVGLNIAVSGATNNYGIISNGISQLGGTNLSSSTWYTGSAVSGMKIQNPTTNSRTSLALVGGGGTGLGLVADLWLFNTSDITTNYSGIVWGYETGSSAWGFNVVKGGTETAKSIYFNATNGQNAATSNLFLPTSGNVLIGTTTDAGYKLDVNGTARISSTAASVNTLSVVNPTSSSNLIYAQGHSGSSFYIDYYNRVFAPILNATNTNYAGNSSLNYNGYASIGNDCRFGSMTAINTPTWGVGTTLGMMGNIRYASVAMNVISAIYNGGNGTKYANTATLLQIGINASDYLGDTTADLAFTTVALNQKYDITRSGSTLIGLDYNPTFVSNSGKHYAAIFRSGSVGIGTATPSNSAILDITSTTQGFLPPRMTTVQKTAITSPAAGLMVYDTTLNKLCVFTTAWETITSL